MIDLNPLVVNALIAGRKVRAISFIVLCVDELDVNFMSRNFDARLCRFPIFGLWKSKMRSADLLESGSDGYQYYDGDGG